MARKGENIRKRTDGRWEGRYQIVEDGVTKTKSVYATTYRDVKRKLCEQKNNIERGSVFLQNEHIEKNNLLTLDMVATEWLLVFPQQYKHSTYIKYKNIYHTHIQPYFGNVQITSLTNDYVKKHIDVELSQSLSRSVYCVLNQIVAFASTKYQINEQKFDRSNNHNVHHSIDTLDVSEQAKLLKYLIQDIDIYKLGIYICLSTGLRLGEVCALKWADIDMDLQLLHVNRTVQRINVDDAEQKTILMETPPKSFHSKREIPLSNQLYTLLQEFYCNDIYVLNGNMPMEPRTLQNKFKKYLKLSGVRETNFHSLRHTFATNCIQTGADVKSVSEVLGHSDVRITLNRYVHPSIDTKREYLNSLSSIYGQISGQRIS